MEAKNILVESAVLALAIFGVGATILWFWSARRGWKILGASVVVVLVLGVVFGGLVRVGWVVPTHRFAPKAIRHQWCVETTHPTPAYSVVESKGVRIRTEPPPAAVRPSGPWPVAIGSEFRPDNYPSVASAARAVAGELADAMSTMMLDNGGAGLIRVSGKEGGSVLNTVAAVLTKRWPEAKVHVEAVHGAMTAPTERDAPGTVSVRVEVESRSKRTPNRDETVWQTSDSSGKLSVEASGPAGGWSKRVAFVEKPWVEKFAEFASRGPERRWLVAGSPEPCVSQFEAESDALQDAARKLLPDVCRHTASAKSIMRAFGHVPDPQRMSSKDRQFLVGVIQRELANQRYVTDRFVQSFHRPYGQVWREAILVDASQQNVRQIAGACERSLASVHESWARMLMSAGGLLALICVVYVFLNAATKGYYVWSLRVAAMAMLAIGSVAVLFLA